jgi:hypothetical protein
MSRGERRSACLRCHRRHLLLQPPARALMVVQSAAAGRPEPPGAGRRDSWRWWWHSTHSSGSPSRSVREGRHLRVMPAFTLASTPRAYVSAPTTPADAGSSRGGFCRRPRPWRRRPTASAPRQPRSARRRYLGRPRRRRGGAVPYLRGVGDADCAPAARIRLRRGTVHPRRRSWRPPTATSHRRSGARAVVELLRAGGQIARAGCEGGGPVGELCDRRRRWPRRRAVVPASSFAAVRRNRVVIVASSGPAR